MPARRGDRCPTLWPLLHATLVGTSLPAATPSCPTSPSRWVQVLPQGARPVPRRGGRGRGRSGGSHTWTLGALQGGPADALVGQCSCHYTRFSSSPCRRSVVLRGGWGCAGASMGDTHTTVAGLTARAAGTPSGVGSVPRAATASHVRSRRSALTLLLPTPACLTAAQPPALLPCPPPPRPWHSPLCTEPQQ